MLQHLFSASELQNHGYEIDYFFFGFVGHKLTVTKYDIIFGRDHSLRCQTNYEFAINYVDQTSEKRKTVHKRIFSLFFL